MTTVASANLIEKELAAIAGAANVRAETVEILGVTPAISVSPASAEEIAAILRLANERQLVVVPAGGMTKQQVGGIPERVDVLLHTGRMNQVAHYDPGDLTIGVGAGLRFAEMQRRLGEHKQWIPFDPADAEQATVGGLLAANSMGPMRAGFGGLRDFCIGVQFVTADGVMGKGGGRVVKNVAGYDLMKLMIGSHGSLAIITGANFKVYPKPSQTLTFVAPFISLREALNFRDMVVRSPLWPMCLEVISPRAPEYLCDPVPARDPDDYAPSQPVVHMPNEWQIAVRVSGSDNILARCRRELGSAVRREIEGRDEDQFWNWVTQFEHSIVQRHRNAMVIHTHVTIQDVPTAVQALERAAPDHDFIPAMLGRASTGNLIMGFVPLSVSPPSAMQYANCASQFRGLLPSGSSAMVTQCPKEAKTYFDVWGTTPTDLKLMKQVKQALDPNNILNRGRFIV
jgi:glycolate oxidase FAD binding subunit